MKLFRDLPYDVHTGRELEFMLKRRKPLAHFSDAYPAEPDEEIFPEAAFAPFVSDGTFEVRDYVELLTEPPPRAHPAVRGIPHLFYARPSEAWRIDAFIAMLAASKRAGWSEGLERLEGSLLGYTDSEIDAWLDYSRRCASNYRLERP